jgi:hypothetical protein
MDMPLHFPPYLQLASEDSNEISYITLTHLLTIVTTFRVFAERPLNAKGDSEAPVLIDYNPGNTIGKTGVVQASIDPKNLFSSF